MEIALKCKSLSNGYWLLALDTSAKLDFFFLPKNTRIKFSRQKNYLKYVICNMLLSHLFMMNRKIRLVYFNGIVFWSTLNSSQILVT